MNFPRWTAFWVSVIGVLVVVEFAEITRLFTVPISIAYLNPVGFLSSLVVVTILALVGAVFVGFYLSSQIYAARGFTPFEQEMLRMRQDVLELKEELARLRVERTAPPAARGVPGTPPGPTGSSAVTPPDEKGGP
jgi:hypothetical protein